METNLLIFLSSVINERTKPLRAIIKQYIQDTGWAYVWVFEKEPPHPRLKESFLSKIEMSDLFVVLLWDDITDTVRTEFEHAKSVNIPILVFRVNAGSSTGKLVSFFEEISSQLKWATCEEEELPSTVLRTVISTLIDSHRLRHVKQTYRHEPAYASVDKQIDLKPKPPLSEQEAALSASSVLPGRIVRAIHFTDQQDGRWRLAVLAATTEQTHLYKAFLLVEFAGGYRIEWESEAEQSGWPWCDPAAWFAAQDIDKDGRAEVFYAGGGHGTGSGADKYYLYVPNIDKSFHVTLHETRDPYYRTWVEPCPELLKSNNVVYVNAVEGRMAELRIFDRTAPGPRSPDVLWYIDNGFLKTGKVMVRRFPGAPKFGASEMAKHRDGDIEWHAFFKGPVIGHDLLLDESFVVYGPSTMYHWPTCFASNSKYLWFGTRGDGVFQYDKTRQFLKQMPSTLLEQVAGDVDTLEVRGSMLVVNDTHQFEVPWD
jgi:hypothetical protein